MTWAKSFASKAKVSVADEPNYAAYEEEAGRMYTQRCVPQGPPWAMVVSDFPICAELWMQRAYMEAQESR